MLEILVRPIEIPDIAGVVKLLLAQQSRLARLDIRLEVPSSPEHLAAFLAEECQKAENPPLIAQHQGGPVRGYALSSLYEISAESEMLAFFTARNGITQQIALPDPHDADALPIASALLHALDERWQKQETLADLFFWPSCDPWLETLLLANHFLADSVLASRAPHPLPLPRSSPALQISTRQARPEDEEALVALHLAEVAFHLPYTPFIHMVPALETAFRKNLHRQWKGERLEEGAPLVLVAEWEGEVIAMAESYLQNVSPKGNNRLPAGHYGYMNSVSVREDLRGKGVGRILVQAVLDAFAPLHVDGFTLWFNSSNPLSGPFWTYLGFFPFWTRYTRLRTMRES